MGSDQHYDVIVIGTGAGGGTLAHRLAPTGKRILLLERGDYLPRERDNWDSSAVFVRGKYRAPEYWYDRHGNEFPPEVNYYVGGNTKFYGAALFRLRPQDFGEIRHHGGLSPAWPISYADLEPYYTQAEHLYRVHGRRGEDPTEGPSSAPGSPRSSTNRGSRGSATTCRSRGCSRSTCRSESTSSRPARVRRLGTAAASAVTVSMGSPACSTPSRTRRSSAWTRRWSTPTSSW
jgi:choline dehydrogenase-like flavoprotein